MIAVILRSLGWAFQVCRTLVINCFRGRHCLIYLRSTEGLHGVVSGCGAKGWVNGTGCPTDFPAPIALGATYDKALWHSVGQTIGLEARALSNQQVAGIYLFTPNINLVRDPRWGRNQVSTGPFSA